MPFRTELRGMVPLKWLRSLQILCYMLFLVHLQETGSRDGLFDVTREGQREGVTLAAPVSLLLHYMKCRSWSLRSKSFVLNPHILFHIFPDPATLADESLTCMFYNNAL